MDKFKVMIVDDQVWIRAMLLEALSSLGYKTIEASNGTEALLVAHRENPDIALIDMNIPGIDGFSLLANLKEIKPDVAAVFMSGCSDENYEKQALKRGAYGFLVKPFDLEDLKNLLNNISTTLGVTARGETKWERGTITDVGIS